MRNRTWSLKNKRLGAAILGTVVGVLFSIPPSLDSQVPSPLTVQPSTGRVGVNTTNPAYPLDVSGTVNATSFRGDGSQLTNLPAGGSQWTTNGTSIYYSNGNVGVGTTGPVSKLQIGGDVALQSMAGGTARGLPAGGTLIWNDGGLATPESEHRLQRTHLWGTYSWCICSGIA